MLRRSVAVSPVIEDAEGLTSKFTRLRLAPWMYRTLWTCVVLVSLCNCLLATVFAALYYGGLTIRDGYMVESVGLLSLRNIPYVLSAYVLVAGYFGSVFVEAVSASVQARRLLIQRPQSQITVSSFCVVRAWRRLWYQWSSLFGPGGLFELTPESFEFLFLLREVVEVVTQTYQAYKCSTLISQRWINTFYVSMLAANCWIAPIIHLCARHNRSLQRFLYLCSDVVLDFASTLIIPLLIICSVVLSAFDDNINRASGGEYAFDVPYDDVYLMNMVKSSQQIFVVTWFDFLTKMMPFYSMASCISHIKNLVEPPTSPETHRDHALLAVGGSKSFRQRILKKIHTSTRNLASKSSPRSRARLQRFCRSPIVRFLTSVRFVHALFVLWGIGILACHLDAEIVSRSAPALASVGCKAHSQPWLVRDYSCTILEINCYRRGIQGQDQEIDAALQLVNPLGVGSLIISHCPLLHMPPRLLTLRNLIGLEITNVTLVAWGEDAALDESSTPALQYLCLVRTNMTQLPEGLQTKDFPNRLRDITIAGSNITDLPKDLHTKWRNLLNLYLERTQISQLPETITYMHAGRLSLMGNQLTSIPDDLLGLDGRNQFQVLSVARNPVTKWPSRIGELSELRQLIMDYTEIDQLPPWLLEEGAKRLAGDADAVPIVVSAGGSALCRKRSAQAEAIQSPGLRIECREKLDFEFQGYPMTFNAQIRQP